MNQTTKRDTKQRLAVDIESLAAMLSCGTATAKKIAELAEARVYVGRRVLYSVKKVQEYLDVMSE